VLFYEYFVYVGRCSILEITKLVFCRQRFDPSLQGYLCELSAAQIRDGLHILGQCPNGESLVDTLQALTRLSNLDVPSLREAISALFGLSYTDLSSKQGARVRDLPPMLSRLADRPLATAGDAVQAIDELAKYVLSLLAQQQFNEKAISHVISQSFGGLVESAEMTETKSVLEFVCKNLVPSLKDTSDEIAHLLTALSGEFVPAGPSGSPTRGMAHLLPTGRNFYACDPNSLPSMAAWEVGQKLATEVVNRYIKDENGVYPEHVVSCRLPLYDVFQGQSHLSSICVNLMRSAPLLSKHSRQSVFGALRLCERTGMTLRKYSLCWASNQNGKGRTTASLELN